MLGDIGAIAFGGTFFASWGIESSETGVEKASLPPSVKSSAVLAFAWIGLIISHGKVEIFPIAIGLIGADAGAPDFGNEETGNGEGIIANEFGIDAEAALAGEFAVVRIGGEEFRGDRGDLAVGVTGDDAADHPLHIPAAVHEFAGEPIEEGGVGGGFSLGAEVIEHLAEAGTEELFPETIHDRASGEGIFAGDQPLGEIESGGIAAFDFWLGEVVGEGGFDHLPGFIHPVPSG